MRRFLLFAMLVLAAILAGVAIYLGLQGSNQPTTPPPQQTPPPTGTSQCSPTQTDLGGEGCGGGGCAAGTRHQLRCVCKDPTQTNCTAGYETKGFCVPDTTCPGGTPTVKKYGCNQNYQCVEDANGSYSALADCQAECQPAQTQKRYACSQDYKCVEAANGEYTSQSGCQTNCKLPGSNPPPSSNNGGELPETALISNDIDRLVLAFLMFSFAVIGYRKSWGKRYFEPMFWNLYVNWMVPTYEDQVEVQQKRKADKSLGDV